MSFADALRVVTLILLATAGGCTAADNDPPAYPSPEAVVPLAVGAGVPSVVVRTVAEEPVDLAGLVRERGALLVFYRGGW